MTITTNRANRRLARQVMPSVAPRAMLPGRSIVNITDDVRKYAAEQAISEKKALKKGREEPSPAESKVEGFEPPGGEREDFCAVKGRRPRLREQPSQFADKGSGLYAKA